MYHKAMRYVPALLALLVVVFASSSASATDHPNILLITLDTVRADHLGCYGSPANATPVLDRLAAGGVLFESAYTSTPITLPSHTSLLTGLYPFRSGVRDNGVDRLPESATTLAELLHARGYSTMAVVSAAVLERTFGLDQGFDVYDEDVQYGERDPLLFEERSAEQVDAAVLRQAASLKPPFLLWVHYFDAHFPYNPPAPYSRQYASDLYTGEIAFVDAQLGRLLDSLSSRKLMDNTIVVVAADHGESLGEHGEKTHGVFLYESDLRVPLLFSAPGRLPAGARIKGLARLVDVVPTLLDLAGLPAPKGIDGRSLKPAIASGRTGTKEAYQETLLPWNSFGWSPLYGLRTDSFHLVHAPKDELYEPASDPRETSDLSHKQPEKVAGLLEQLDAYPYKKAAAGKPAEVSPELREQLESLGYVSGPAPPAAGSTSLRDPKDGAPLLQKIDEVRAMIKQGEAAKAASLLESFVEADPDNSAAQVTLATALMQEKKYADAQKHLEAALRHRQTDYLFYDLANCLALQGKYETAAENYGKAISARPRFTAAYAAWANMELVRGRSDSAQRVVDEALGKHLDDPELFVTRGKISAGAGDYASARGYFQRAVERNQSYADAHLQLGRLYYAMKQPRSAITEYQKVVALQPGDAASWKTLGSLYLYAADDPGKARACFQKALQLQPDAPDAADIRDILEELSHP